MDTQLHMVRFDEENEITTTVTNSQQFEEIFIKVEPLEENSQDNELYENVLESVRKEECISDNNKQIDKKYDILPVACGLGKQVSPQRKHLKLKEKAEILEHLKAGRGATFLSRKYGVAKSTISSIKNKRIQIMKNVDCIFTGIGKKKTLKSAVYPKMEKALYQWFLKQREHVPIDGEMIKEKAKNLHQQFYDKTSFHASNGWLQKFKIRYGIRFFKISGEKLSPQPELIDPFKETLLQKIEELGLTLDQIYNANESGLYWKHLPDKTYVSLMEKTAPERKTEKQRITFMACANASGNHKVNLLVIGKAKNPRTFKNFNLPVNYKNSKTARMTTEIFKEWFQNKFIPEVKEFLKNRGLPIRALLVLENAPSHPPEEELNSIDELITVMFMYMPPNVTALDQNAIRLTKLFYRKNLLSHVLSKKDVGAALNAISLRDAVMNLKLAWIKLKPEVIQKCWHNILPRTRMCKDNEDDIPLNILKLRPIDEDSNCVEMEVMNMLQIISPNAYERNDIVAWNEDIQAEIDQQEEIIENYDDTTNEEPDMNDDKLISCTQALTSLNIVLQWAEENTDDVEFSKILVLQDIRSNLVKKLHNVKKTN